VLILVTGSSGAVGRVVCAALRGRGHTVRGFDRAAGHRDDLVGELSDAAALERACAGVEAVVHLAATPDKADFARDLVPNNIVGSHALLDAVRTAGARRVVLASTARVVVGHLGAAEPIPSDAPFAVGDSYAASKACVEVLGELYARAHGLEVICARIGWFLRDRAEAQGMAVSTGGRRWYLSWDDCARFFTAAVEAPHRGFAAWFVTSLVEPSLFDVAPAAAIGFAPRDRWPEGTALEMGP
jgi:uronate dehydrogenase